MTLPIQFLSWPVVNGVGSTRNDITIQLLARRMGTRIVSVPLRVKPFVTEDMDCAFLWSQRNALLCNHEHNCYFVMSNMYVTHSHIVNTI